jgi:exodeoxyribonuclease VII small subunit
MSDIAAMTFEAAMAELEKVVRDLESGNVELEKSIALYERGAALKAHCEAKLKAAEERVEKITLNAAGVPTGTAKVEGL